MKKLATWGKVIKETEMAMLIETEVGNVEQMEETTRSQDWFPKSQLEILRRGNSKEVINDERSNTVFFVSKKKYFPSNKSIEISSTKGIYSTTADEVKEGNSNSNLFKNTKYTFA